jgi:hypothetical protein
MDSRVATWLWQTQFLPHQSPPTILPQTALPLKLLTTLPLDDDTFHPHLDLRNPREHMYLINLRTGAEINGIISSMTPEDAADVQEQIGHMQDEDDLIYAELRTHPECILPELLPIPINEHGEGELEEDTFEEILEVIKAFEEYPEYRAYETEIRGTKLIVQGEKFRADKGNIKPDPLAL